MDEIKLFSGLSKMNVSTKADSLTEILETNLNTLNTNIDT